MKHSARLILCKPVDADLQRFYEINADPETNLFNPNGAMNFETAEKGFGTWSIREKEDPGYIIGFGGLCNRLYGEEVKLNLGYRFDKEYWGKGYATELSQYAIAFGFDELNINGIFALVRPRHLASIKVLEKCKMKLVDELDDVPNALLFKNEVYSFYYYIIYLFWLF
jgi:[ribosomal protein S5]-alanine N-acetyltransferase